MSILDDVKLDKDDFNKIESMLKQLSDYCVEHNISLITDGTSGKIAGFKGTEFLVTDWDDDINPENLEFFHEFPISVCLNGDLWHDRIHIQK